MSDRPKMVSIITVNFNETVATCALLDSIRRQAYRDVEVIVVDNASRENPAAIFQAQYPEVKFLRSEQNLGFAGGNNLALPLATGEVLFFVNNDAELEPGCIENLLQLLENQPNVGLVSPLICYFPQSPAQRLSPIVQYAGMSPVSAYTGRNHIIGALQRDTGQFQEARSTAYAHGAAMMVPRRVLDQVGPMWEGFFLYYEELDWAERMRRAGWGVWVVPQARVWHKESLTIGKMGPTKTFYLTRNRILFMRRHVKGPKRAIFYAFMGLIALPAHTFSRLAKGEWGNVKALWQGVFLGFSAKTG